MSTSGPLSTVEPAADAASTRRFALRMPASVSALRERDFRVVWMGQAISMTGTWMQTIAAGLLVLQLWDSALALGIQNFANALPSLVVMLFGGVLADRADKRRILLVTQVVMMLLAASLGILVVTGRVEFWMVIVAAAALGVAFGYDMPAYQALMPELVGPEKIGQVVALNSTTFHGTRMIGPALAGIVIGAFGLATAYFLNAASFVAVIASLLIIRYRSLPRPASEHVGAIEGLKQGLRHVRGRPHLMSLLWLTALNTTFVFPIIAVLTPFYVREVLEAGPGTLGALFAMSGLGSLAGAMMLIWWPEHARARRIWLAVLCAPVGLAVMALTRSPAVAVGIQAILSFSFSSQLGLITMMMQESTPPSFRGRVMSLNGIAFNGTVPFAALAASGLTAVTSLPIVMLGAAAAYVALATLVLMRAAGGIQRVALETRSEYLALMAADVESKSGRPPVSAR